MTRTCKYGCPVLLGEWDENARKYHEASTGELHTRERCEEAKANARRTQGANNHNNHGNENQSSTTVKGWVPTKEQAEKIAEETKNYVDHTQGPKLKLRIFTNPTPGGLELEYNNFAAVANIKFSQYHPQGSLYTMAVWYEEVPLKQ